MNIRSRLQRVEQAVPPPGCLGCRDRRGRMLMVTALRLPDGTTSYPDGEPAACTICDSVPEFVIEIVESIALGADEDSAGPSLARGKD
jgi:hypothetical protein